MGRVEDCSGFHEKINAPFIGLSFFTSVIDPAPRQRSVSVKPDLTQLLFIRHDGK